MSDIDDEIRRLVGEYEPPTPGTQPFGRTTTDKPRLIVVVHPDIYDEAQRAVTRLGHGDVLVQCGLLKLGLPPLRLGPDEDIEMYSMTQARPGLPGWACGFLRTPLNVASKEPDGA